MNIVRIAIAALLSLSAAASAQDGGKPISIPTISLGTATPGGGFPLYGGAYAEVMNRADPTLSIVPRATKGSFENIPLLVAGEPAYEAFQGIGRPPTRLKIISALYSNPGMFVVRADSPYRTIRDLVGKPVAFGARGSGLPVLARYVLDGLGLKQEGDFEAVYLDRAGDGPAMVLDGRVAALWGAGLGWPGFKAMADTPSGARFIVPSAEEIAQIRARHSFLKPMQVAPYSYSRQDVAIDSVGSWSYLLARETLPDDIAYRLAKTLHGAEAQFGARLTQAKESTAANTVASAPDQSLIHPGALKYFREIGLVK
jgi:TRAP transporter TAXI family solute receptor